MTEKIKRLRELKEQPKHRAYLISCRRELTKLRNEQSNRTAAFKAAMEAEQRDVENLQKSGLKNLFHSLTGKKAEIQEKEQREAREARLRYESVLRELADTEHRLRKVEEELSDFDVRADEYDALLKELLGFVQDSDAEEKIKQRNVRLSVIAGAKDNVLYVQEQIALLDGHLDEARLRAWVNNGQNMADDALRQCRRIMVPLQEQIKQLNGFLSALDMERELRFYASLISGLGETNMGGQVAIEMVKNAKQQNRTMEQALEEISEQLEDMERKTQRDLDEICEYIIKTAEKGMEGE